MTETVSTMIEYVGLAVQTKSQKISQNSYQISYNKTLTNGAIFRLSVAVDLTLHIHEIIYLIEDIRP